MIAHEEHSQMETSHTPTAQKHFLIEALQFILIAVLIILPFRIFIAQPFVVNGASMDPTFHTGEYLIVDQISYTFNKPKRGDVIIFKYPRNPRKFFIKRIIGLPGEAVTITDGEVTISNDQYPEGILLDEPYITHHSNGNSTASLEEDEYFVLGDNRSGSSDSRSWGALHEKYIIGRPFIRLLPLNEIRAFPGVYTAYY